MSSAAAQKLNADVRIEHEPRHSGLPAPRRAAVYRPRRPRASPLGQLLDRCFDEFQRVYDERYRTRYGFCRPVIASTIEKFPGGGDLRESFTRVRCPRRRYESLVAFSCRRA